MKCGYCGYEFRIEEAEKGCEKCGSFGGCNLVKCPKCEYEQPKIPEWINRLTDWLKKKQIKVKQ
ncbi:MAG TPA: hypothetical protein VNK96_00060 [Fimbriimonadales bacterium]|nr:hypothetical protein [Fimbriimonadales bacterium]